MLESKIEILVQFEFLVQLEILVQIEFFTKLVHSTPTPQKHMRFHEKKQNKIKCTLFPIKRA